MPKHARRVPDVTYAEPPGLHGRRFWSLNAKYLRQIESLDMFPPRVEVVDHHLHHAVFGPFLFIVSLQDERAFSHAENGDIAIKQFRETKRFVEGFARVEVHCGDERAQRFAATWNRHPAGPPATDYSSALSARSYVANHAARVADRA